MTSNTLKNQRGVMLLWLMVVASILGSLAFFFSDALIRHSRSRVDDDRYFEAELLASDLKELGKYLILYEKAFHIRDPLNIGNDIRNGVWPHKFGSPELKQMCGGFYDYPATRAPGAAAGGAFSLPPNGDLFCPIYFRTNVITGSILESVLMDRWVNDYAPIAVNDGFGNNLAGFTRIRTGVYRLILPIAGPVAAQARGVGAEYTYFGANPANLFVRFDRGQGNQSIIANANDLQLSAFIEYEFYTDGSGFIPMLSERYVKITGRVEFRSGFGLISKSHTIEDSETMMMLLTTPRNFAIFNLLPQGNVNNFLYDPAANNEASFRASMDINRNTQIIGRTYFNGNIDVPLADLPQFRDAVLVSGNVTNNLGAYTAANIADIMQKFPKGLLTNLPAQRFIFDNCGNPPINNQSDFTCASINSYLVGTFNSRTLPNVTSDPNLPVTLGVGGPTWPGAVPTRDMLRNNWATRNNMVYPLPTAQLITTGNNGAAFYIVGMIGHLEVPTGGANILGTILGGYIHVTGNAVSFRSISAAQVGTAGIGDAARLNDFNSSVERARSAVTAPLINIPVVFSSREGFR